MEESALERLVPRAAQVQKLATGMKFIEGPVWVSESDSGYLIFSDIPANELKRWSERDGLSAWRTPSFGANGNTLDARGRLLTCEHGSRTVSITEDNVRKTLVERYEGKLLNSPNDLVVKRDGTVWFTDPSYGTPSKNGVKQMELDGKYVFRFDPKNNELKIAGRGFDMPNGLCFSPDEKKLYVADSGAPKHIRAFDVQDDGTLAGGDVFARIDKGGPDGIRCDELGNLWSSAGGGVQIFSPDGKLIGRISVPESPANLCFGGPDGKTLFMTARTSLYSIQTTVKGAAK